MRPLYEILKAEKGIPVSDTETMFYGAMNSCKVKGYTGTLPVSLPTSGNTMEAYRIYGNTVEMPENYVNMADMVLNFGSSAKLMFDDDGWLTTYTSGDNRGWSQDKANLQSIPLKAGTYTATVLFSEFTGNKNSSMAIGIVNGSTVFRLSDGTLLARERYSKTFTLENDCNIWLMIKPFEGHVKVMITAGSTPPAIYVPYGSPAAESTGIPTEDGEPAGYKLPVITAEIPQNMLPPVKKWAEGSIVNGVIKPYESYTDTRYTEKAIPVTAGTRYRFRVYQNNGGASGYWFSLSWYDANDTYISENAQFSRALMYVTPPQLAAKLRVSIRTYGHETAWAEFFPADRSITATNIYLGDKKLEADEFADSATGMIFRKSGDVLVPTAPPAPLPDIPTCRRKTEFSCESIVPPDHVAFTL
ncbi:hypothetical protein [uncultured Ruminococcus sp.]|uniref:hypothetical protein n=1 Tax=uncultured Ruminococcus sp. TaxID=165186 RepID=UPI000EC062B3|nr:hypothetical protein [uncultured Ruminococcus sp.]HCJ41519.1 hypothetical protein [Ruminococcus sp.]